MVIGSNGAWVAGIPFPEDEGHLRNKLDNGTTNLRSTLTLLLKLNESYPLEDVVFLTDILPLYSNKFVSTRTKIFKEGAFPLRDQFGIFSLKRRNSRSI